MTKEELINHCENAIYGGFWGEREPEISLVMRGSLGMGSRLTRRLWPKGPKGTAIAEVEENKILVVFKAKEVLAAVKEIEAEC